MDDLSRFCRLEPDCTQYGLRGRGTIAVRTRYGPARRRLLYCKTCKKRFPERKGTPLFHCRLPDGVAHSVSAYVREGCGARATGRLVGVALNTVLRLGHVAGRKRLNILGAYCPDDQKYLDLRLTRDDINGEQFVNLLRLLREQHPEVKRFILCLDNAAYYGKPVVLEWLRRHPEFDLEPVPPYSPNVNLIERLWKFLKEKALGKWHPTFEAMQRAVSGVLDHLGQYRDRLATLMVDEFHIIEAREIPVQYRGVA